MASFQAINGSGTSRFANGNTAPSANRNGHEGRRCRDKRNGASASESRRSAGPNRVGGWQRFSGSSGGQRPADAGYE